MYEPPRRGTYTHPVIKATLLCLILSEEGSCQGRRAVVRIHETTSGGCSRCQYHRGATGTFIQLPSFWPWLLGGSEPACVTTAVLSPSSSGVATIFCPPLPPALSDVLSNCLASPATSDAAESRQVTSRTRGRHLGKQCWGTGTGTGTGTEAPLRLILSTHDCPPGPLGPPGAAPRSRKDTLIRSHQIRIIDPGHEGV